MKGGAYYNFNTMAKYKIKESVISVYLRGRLFTKKSKVLIFDTEGNFKNGKEDVESAFKSGYLDLIEETPVKVVEETPAETVKEVVKEAPLEVIKESPKKKTTSKKSSYKNKRK